MRYEPSLPYSECRGVKIYFTLWVRHKKWKEQIAPKYSENGEDLLVVYRGDWVYVLHYRLREVDGVRIGEWRTIFRMAVDRVIYVATENVRIIVEEEFKVADRNASDPV